MAITISGQNNNDKILASDGVLDQISGFNVVGVMTATTFDVTTKHTANHIDVGSSIQLGNAGIITATTLIGNVTGNVNSTSNLLLQISGSEKFRVGNGGQLGIGGANYGTSGQVLTSSGSGSAPTWSTINSDKITEGNTEAEVIDTGSNGFFRVVTESSERLRITSNGIVNIGDGVGNEYLNSTLKIRKDQNSVTRVLLRNEHSGGGSAAAFQMGASGNSWMLQCGSAANDSNAFTIRVDGTSNGNTGTERFRIRTDGKVGVNTTGPSQQFTSYASSGYPVLANGPSNGIGLGNNGAIVFGTKDLGSPAPGILDASALEFKISGTPKMNIDSSGKLLSGHTAALTKFHGPGSTTKRNPHIQVNGTNVNGASMSLTSWDNNVNAYYGPAIYLAKSGSSTIGTNSRVSNQNSILGSIVFSGDDGDEFIKGAMIQGAVDNIDGAQTGGNDMPGRLQFLTTQDGAQEPTERLRILSNGRIKFIEDPIQRNSGSVDSFSGDGAYMQHYVSRNGATYRRNLDIAAVGDGSWGCSIRFSTNPDSSSTSLERMRIDHRGIVTKPYHPSFCARHDDNSTFSGNIIVLTRISTSWDVWNTGGHYSTSTGKFTAPVAGVYYFEGQLMTTGHSNGDNIQDMFSLESNRGRITYVRQRESYFSTSTNANGYYTNSLGSSVRLAAGDTVWLQRHSSQSWGYSNRYYSYFTGWLIG